MNFKEYCKECRAKIRKKNDDEDNLRFGENLNNYIMNIFFDMNYFFLVHLNFLGSLPRFAFFSHLLEQNHKIFPLFSTTIFP